MLVFFKNLEAEEMAALPEEQGSIPMTMAAQDCNSSFRACDTLTDIPADKTPMFRK